MLQQLVPNQGDGWKMALEELARYYEQHSTVRASPEEFADDNRSILELSEAELPDSAREKAGMFIDSAATLGRRTAEMHLALATPTEDEAFRPEPMTSDRTGAPFALSCATMRRQRFATLKANLSSLPDEFVEMAALALGQRRRILDRFRAIEQMDTGSLQIRIHGDYHLGQVLWVENDFVILDFEGEPARPLAQAAPEAAGAQRRGRDAAFVQLRGLCQSAVLYGAPAGGVRAAGAVGHVLGEAGLRWPS